MPTIRRRYPKVGRNEPCPCGRLKRPSTLDEEGVITAPIKYKHCCGNIDNQRKAMVVRRYISNKIHEVLSRKKVSKLHALVNFFKKKAT